MREAPPVDQWAYFLKNAGNLSRRQIEEQLPDPEFAVAAGVLEMIAKSDRERMLYEARLKLHRDETGRMKQALEVTKAEGRAEGRAEGELRICQRILGIPESTDEDLARMEPAEIARLAAELCQRISPPRS